MKDIKTFVIGFLTCCCLFLIMGQTKSEPQYGKYQGFGNNWLINTATGDMYKGKTTLKGTKWKLFASGFWD